MSDKNNLARIAQYATVEYKVYTHADGITGDWIPVTNARVIEVEHNIGSKPNQAIIDLADSRWNTAQPLYWGYLVRIRVSDTVLFQGFITEFKSGFSSSPAAFDSVNTAAATEYVQVVAMDYRNLFEKTCPILGQAARGYDDYETDGTPKNSAVFLDGLPCVFNPSGMGNMDATAVVFPSWDEYTSEFTINVFSNPSKSGTFWTAKKAIEMITSPIYNRARKTISATPVYFYGLNHTDFSTVLNHIEVDTLDMMAALEKICSNLGWTWREEYTTSAVIWVFYKPGLAAGYERTSGQKTILHTLHAPAVGEDIAAAVNAGAKMLAAMDLSENVNPVINEPWGMGSRHQFEITAQLVPAWLDSDLTLDSANSYADVFKTDSDLAEQTNPNQFSYYSRYHTQGNAFKRDVGRKWALNESGRYTDSQTYDRGTIFDFSTVIPDDYLKSSGKRLFGRFDRKFLPCLTFDTDTINSVGVKVEMSFDAGTTWFAFDGTVEVLQGECGIRIVATNLAEILAPTKGTITSGSLAGKELNYFSSLADDKVNARVFKTGGWKTRLRVTASVEMDRRLMHYPASVYSGSPFRQKKIYNYADRYGFSLRTKSSSLYAGGLPAWDTNEQAKLDAQMNLIREANEDMATIAPLVLDRLWLGEGGGTSDFALGDCIDYLSGRNYPLYQTLGPRTVYPEIVSIRYLFQQQKQVLQTRDITLIRRQSEAKQKRKTKNISGSSEAKK